MTPYEFAMLVLVGAWAFTVLHIGRRLSEIERKLEEIATRLNAIPRYFADAGKPSQAKRALEAVRSVSKKGFGMSVQNGKAVHDPRPGIEEA